MKRHNPRIQALLTVLLIIVCLCQTAFAESVSCVVSSKTKVYKSASTSSTSTSIAKNTKVTLTAYADSWAKISKSGTTAYIPVKYLTLKESMTVYAVKSTYLYKKASTSTKLVSLAQGDKLTVTKRSGNYFYGKDKNSGKSGYVKLADVSTTNPGKSSSSGSKSVSSMSNSEKIDYIIKLAKSLQGRPYSTSANPPKTFDCSRFTSYCFKQAGVSLSGTAKDQGYNSKYTKVSSTSSLKKGDIVCFDTNSTDMDLSDHVGIYLGSGQFIHASSAGGKVMISSLSSGYYKKVFSWGRRVIK